MLITNWWGSNNNPLNSGEILLNNGYTNYNSWLVLSIDPNSVNSGGNASITADLTHNNLGEDTSSQGHVIKGIPITFSTSYGTISNSALTFNGQAKAILNLGTTQSKTVKINASLDSQTVSRQMVIAPGVATLNITSTALNNSNNQPININYTVHLNSSVTWISILWKNIGLFHGQLQIIVNGTVVNSKEYVNPAYNTWKNSYRSAVFSAIIYANNYILADGMDPQAIPSSFWNDLTSEYNLTSTELQFIKNHRLEFVDDLTVNLTYPGADAPDITITDPETNNTIDLSFTGNEILRTSPIMYMDGLFSAGYEGVKSFSIATTKVNNNILDYWTDQNTTYPAGAMKAAYGTFLTALLMEYIHDQLADAAATEFNVTWARTSPIIVSVGDDPYQTYLTLECDHGMGMTVIGSLKNTILFNYACSSQISTIEYRIMNSLDFIYQYGTVSMDIMGSVTRDMLYVFWTGTDLESFTQNGYIVIKLVGHDDLVLLYDPETGIMRDINTANGFCGAYCFHDQITELAIDFSNFLLDHQATIWRDFFGALGAMGSYYGLYTSIPVIDAVITVGSGLTLSLGFSFFGASIGFGLLLVDIRTNYVPIEYWKHFSYHRTWLWGYEQRSYIGSDNCIHYIEIPKNSDGTLNWNEAIYY